MRYESGDYVKFDVTDDETGESEWMWLRLDYCDEAKRLAFGWLDSQPVVFQSTLAPGQHLAVSYDKIREHLKQGPSTSIAPNRAPQSKSPSQYH